MQVLKSRSFRIASIVLFIIGLGISIWQGITRNSPLLVWISDLFVTEFLLFLLYGILRTLRNMHAFAFAAYSFRFVHRLFRNQKVSGKDSPDEYRQYLESRPQHPEAKGFLVLAAAFLILSLIFIPFATRG